MRCLQCASGREPCFVAAAWKSAKSAGEVQPTIDKEIELQKGKSSEADCWRPMKLFYVSILKWDRKLAITGVF